jgi:Arc/MetJ-type ribon-helix-helix transcriptional regulator
MSAGFSCNLINSLDSLITAGVAANRSDSVRWALARIRERPAFARLTEWVRGLDELKEQF